MRAWLVAARGERTQKQIARAAGITQHYYSMLENGKRAPSVSVARLLGAALDIDWRLFFEEGKRNGVDRAASVAAGSQKDAQAQAGAGL